jgi:hypothetical protein
MTRTIYENLNATARFIFSINGNVVFDVTSANAAYEFSEKS